MPTVTKIPNLSLPSPLGHFRGRKMPDPTPYSTLLELDWLRWLDYRPGVYDFWFQPDTFVFQGPTGQAARFTPAIRAAVEWAAHPVYFDVQTTARTSSKRAQGLFALHYDVVAQAGAELVQITEAEARPQPHLAGLKQLQSCLEEKYVELKDEDMLALQRHVRTTRGARIADVLVVASGLGLSLQDVYAAVLDRWLHVDLSQPVWLNTRVYAPD